MCTSLRIAPLHAFARNRPNPSLEVELVPVGANDLADALHAEHEQVVSSLDAAARVDPFRPAQDLAHLAPLARRGRAIARTEAVLTAGMWLVGTAYNFCWTHDSLRLLAPPDAPRQWDEPTPAMAAGLADHPWTIGELLRFQIPLPRWVPPKRRGRPPNRPTPGLAA